MVVVRIVGGLGNQLFQYAAGRGLADRLGETLALDLSRFPADRQRSFMLDRLRTDFEVASPGTVRWLRAHRVLDQVRPGRRHFRERRGGGFDADWKTLKAPVYLSGYFNQTDYFEGSEARLRDELVLKDPWPEAAAAALARVDAPDSVGVHVRRGDYFETSDLARVYGVCTPAYYARAMDTLRAEHPGVRFTLFSDDPAWAREHVARGDDVETVELGGEGAPHYDLLLLSRCEHLVLSNSTFSWWAAWIHTRTGQVVFPARWHNVPGRTGPSMLPGWRRLEVE